MPENPSPESLLRLSTGCVSGTWNVAPHALRLTSLSGIPVCESEQTFPWLLPELVSDQNAFQFDRVETAEESGATVTALHFHAMERRLDLRYRIFVYPGVPGFRTQLGFRFPQRYSKEDLPGWLGRSFSEHLCLPLQKIRYSAAGYYNDTQHRNTRQTPLLREEKLRTLETPFQMDWANLITLHIKNRALILVKESHKCVNQNGIDTGAFVFEDNSVQVSGLGLCDHRYSGGPVWHHFDEWRDCWATWILSTPDNDSAIRQAVRHMDRARYPFLSERDEHIMCNTWGSGGAGEGSRKAACEETVLKEISSAADLGLDLVQIDDGWQCEADAEKPTVSERDWLPHPSRWPEGWKNVHHAAQTQGIDLGLWFNWNVELEKMLRAAPEGVFRRFKLDFLSAHNRDILERALGKAKFLREENGPASGVNWDITEEAARMGYFLGREYGNYYLCNRTTRGGRLQHVQIDPDLQLRDAWQLGRYLNLNQFQLTVQNLDDLPSPEVSNTYGLAVAMSGIPIFFMLTHLLPEINRNQFRPLIQMYRDHRAALHTCYVEPVGSEPNGSAWTGFQFFHPDQKSGYLLLFREPGQTQPEIDIALPFGTPAHHHYELLFTDSTDVSTEATETGLRVHIAQAGCFCFLRY